MEARDAALEAKDRYTRQPVLAAVEETDNSEPITDDDWSGAEANDLETSASELEEEPAIKACKPVILRRIYKSDTTDSLRKMTDNLQGKLQPKEQGIYQKRPYIPTMSKEMVMINIATISATGFHYNMKNKDNIVFATSLYEIDHILEERYSIDLLSIEETEADLARIPKAYNSYLDTFSKAASDQLAPHRPYDHKIILENGQESDLRTSPLYKMTAIELETLKKFLLENLHKGFLESSQAPYAAPILFVKKPNGGLQLCIDFRKLNAITRKDRYPLPLIDETLARITKAKIFTKLDVRQAFHRIRMDPVSEELTTFRTRYGSYKCKVLWEGLTNGPATYQRYMNDILFDYLDDFCSVYLDDVLVYSENEAEHELHVKKVLQRLRDAGLQVDIRKCEFSVTRTKYLGFIISTDGIEVDPEKVSVIRD